jgi:hypothetical protein
MQDASAWNLQAHALPTYLVVNVPVLAIVNTYVGKH